MSFTRASHVATSILERDVKLHPINHPVSITWVCCVTCVGLIDFKPHKFESTLGLWISFHQLPSLEWHLKFLWISYMAPVLGFRLVEPKYKSYTFTAFWVNLLPHNHHLKRNPRCFTTISIVIETPTLSSSTQKMIMAWPARFWDIQTRK